jgi:CheY-like chemotaxis protein
MARAEKTPSEAQDSEISAVAHNARILLVDDEETLLLAIAKMLRKQGFAVLTAADGTDAIDLLRMHKDEISLLFMDVTLPGLSSREVLEEARRMRPGLPVILTSAHGQNAIDSIFAGVPVQHFIRKPYRLAAVLNLFQSVLSAA